MNKKDEEGEHTLRTPIVGDGMTMRQTWYFVTPTSKMRESCNLLHLPYTGMILAFVVASAALVTGIAVSAGVGDTIEGVTQVSTATRYSKIRFLAGTL
jgi:hypothetical protein